MSKTGNQLPDDTTFTTDRCITVFDPLTGKMFKVTVGQLLDLSTGGSGGGSVQPEYVNCNTDTTVNGGDTVIEWTTILSGKFGVIPHIGVWFDNGNSGYDEAKIPITLNGTPPNEIVVRNGGQSGIIKIFQ